MTTRQEPKNHSLFLSFSLVLISLSPALAADFESRLVPTGVRSIPALGIKPVNVDVQLQIPQLPSLGAALAVPTLPQTLPAAALMPELPAALPAAAAQQAAPQTTGARLEQVGKNVDASLEAVGPISGASASDASGLGGKIQRALDGEAGEAAPAAPPSDNGSGQTPEQAQRLRTLKQVVSMFTEHYAPIEWKQSHRGVDFSAQYEKARAQILANPAMKDHEFQQILADFVESAQDYHASIHFYSTEKAGLPISLLSAQGKYYIAYIDRDELPEAKFPYKVGDEVVELGGKPVGDVAASFTKHPNTAETDARLAELHLTKRARAAGMDVPQGGVKLKVRDAAGAEHETTLVWDYRSEQIPTDVPRRGVPLGPETADPLDPANGRIDVPASLATGRREGLRQLLKKFLPTMAHPQARAFSDMAAADSENGFMIGGKKTYVPDLGKVVWELPAQVAAQLPFVVKIYEDAAGRKIGYVRIPDYMGGGSTDAAAQLFAKLIGKLEAETDGLVIDEVNNPGGDMMYMNDLISMLTDKPMEIPKHRLMIDESDAALATQILQQASDPGIQKEMEDVLHELMAGFAPDQKSTIDAFVSYAKFVLSELAAGRRLTNPTNIFGVKRVEPSQVVRYTKPIVVLINELDFSAADFFAAIMQDNKRATLFGVRTAGAGGGVKDVQVPNQFGIEALAYTWTIAVRPGGSPIENLGVAPDVAYQITADDLRSGFAGYKKALEDVIAKLLPPGTSVKPKVEDPDGGPKTGPRGPRPGPRKPRVKPKPEE